METITKIISDDYKKGLIMFDCQSIDDIRKVGDILSIVGFNMRFANIKIKEKSIMNEETLILLQIDRNIVQIINLSENLKAIYEKKETITPKKKFIIEQITGNLGPQLREYNHELFLNHPIESSVYEFKLDLCLCILNELEFSIAHVGGNATGLEKEEAEKLRRLVNFRYVQEIRQIIHDAKRLNMLRSYE
jgi:hypothetical protein